MMYFVFVLHIDVLLLVFVVSDLSVAQNFRDKLIAHAEEDSGVIIGITDDEELIRKYQHASAKAMDREERTPGIV